MKSIIFWGSYIYFPFAIACLGLIWRGSRAVRVAAFVALFPTSVLGYARFVEPHTLSIHETTIDLGGEGGGVPVRIALFADMQYGIYRNSVSMERIVRKVNPAGVDGVFIAGDFVYHLAQVDIASTFSRLAEVDAPVFTVLGNHDVRHPGKNIGTALKSELERLGVTIVENKAVPVELACRHLNIAGASDLWQGKQSYDYGDALSDAPMLLLVHNPDAALYVPHTIDYDLMLAGHTHGAQIRLPGMTRRTIPTEYSFDKGVHVVETGGKTRKVYVTPGTGMVGLPLRFRMPPRIDVLNLQMPEE